MQASFRLSTIARQMRGYATSARVQELTTPKPDDIVVTVSETSVLGKPSMGGDGLSGHLGTLRLSDLWQ